MKITAMATLRCTDR